MARIRSIKPEFFTNERLSALGAPTHLLAAALLTYADDEGYFNANPGLVRAACGPLRDDFANIPEMLASLLRIDYIRFYDGSNGSRYGHIVEFSKHQRVDHPSASKIKPLLLAPEILAKPREVVAPDQGSGNREQGTGKKTLAAAQPSEFDEAWALYPKRAGSNPKKAALSCWRARVAEGHAPAVMIDGVRKYAAHCKAGGKVGTEYVMQAKRFFGVEKEFLNPWSPQANGVGFDPFAGCSP